MVSMNRLTTERRAQILGMMVEGNSIRAITRMTGASKNTIIKLLEDAGEAFSAYQDQAFRDLKLRIQLDEIWAFCYRKALAISGHGLPSTRKPSWSRPGASATAAARRRPSLSAISRTGWRTAYR